MNVSMFLGVMSLLAAISATSQTGDPSAPASPWRSQTSPVTVELRGLAVISPKVAWASGAKGTVLRTTDGESWSILPVAGAEALDFRDIEAWDENNAIAMSIGPGMASNVYKTTDGGKSWRRVFANPEPTGFWDAITFWDRKNGALFGDPVRGRFQVYLTSDGGESWHAVDDAGLPLALENEGAFAASGSCLVAGSNKRLAFVTGGAAESRVFVSMDGGKNFHVSSSPVLAGAAPKGLFSALWLNGKSLVVVGGDYKERTLDGVNAATSTNGGAHWTPIHAQPVGFLSSVVEGPDAKSPIVAVGLAGTGISIDGGATWKALDATPYNTAGFAKGGGFAVGPKGVIARWHN
ncbi:MAG: YCF48-related protein [Vicinamibacteria bacterium]